MLIKIIREINTLKELQKSQAKPIRLTDIFDASTWLRLAVLAGLAVAGVSIADISKIAALF